MEIPGSARGQDEPEPAAGAGRPAADTASAKDTASSEISVSGGLEGDSPQPATAPRGSANLATALLIYTVLRLALVAALTAVLMFFMPLIVALLFAIIVQLPLSWLLLAGPRRRLNDAMAQSSAKRRSERAKLQSALSGDGARPADR